MDESVVRKALSWIHERFEENPETNRAELIDRASRQFNLSPLQGEFLCRTLLTEKQDIKTASS
ncbi:MAG: hypothetical protein Q7R73_04135 [bacterium]|nr:hypothetical protein [bacterium]